MTFQLVCIEPKELTQYKADMQEAFQKGFEDAFGKTDAVILPEKDIDGVEAGVLIAEGDGREALREQEGG